MMGTSKTFRIPVSTGLFEHYPKIEESIWFFLWAIDKTTQEIPDPDEPGKKLGVVLGGKPQTDEEIAKSFPGASARTIRRYRSRLVREKYLKQRRTPCGHSLWVRNSQKWFSDKGLSTDGQSQGSAINGRSLSRSAINGHSINQKGSATNGEGSATNGEGSATNGEGSATNGDAYRQDSHSKVTRQKERKRKPQEKPQTSRLLSFDDMTLPDETVGDRFCLENKSVEQIVQLISDARFNVEILAGYDSTDELEKSCRKAVQQMRKEKFSGLQTCAAAMDRAMTILKEDFGVNAPRGWLPVLKELRIEGGPATASKSKRQQLEENAVNILGPQSPLGFPDYKLRLKPFEQILIETAKHQAVPADWIQGVDFLNQVIRQHPDTNLSEVVAVRDEIQKRIPANVQQMPTSVGAR
jgi:hypothetical protein